MKYSAPELQAMAVQFIMHQSQNDPKCDELVKRMVERTGGTPEQIVANIHMLASGVMM